MKALIYGNLTVDHNFHQNMFYMLPGGASYYIARSLGNLGVKTLVISPYGEDFPKIYLPHTRFLPEKPASKQTLIFKNIYLPDGTRKQSVENLKDSILPPVDNLPPDIFPTQDLLFVAPILNNIATSHLDKLLKFTSFGLKILLPQGFFRKNLKKEIASVKCNFSNNLFRSFDIIVVSEKDCSEADNLAKYWGQGQTIVIVTRAEKNATVYHLGTKKNYSSFKVKSIFDETGAGDIFAAAFAFAFYKTGKINPAVFFAHAASALSLPLLPKELKYGLQEILYFARHQGIKINL